MKVAVTGGIGVGKSEVMKIIKDLGYKVSSADEINARLLVSSDYISKIEMAFPDVVVNGKIDKTKLRRTIFNDYDKRMLLNSIAHPIIRTKIKESGDNVFIEIPLLFESGMQNLVDKIVVVTAPYQLRVNRLFDRSGIDKPLADKMIASQLSDNERVKYADFVIDNKSSLDELRSKVIKIISELNIK